MNRNKGITICWSGGVDSTALIVKAIKEKERHINLISFALPVNATDKDLQSENKARTDIEAWLRKKYSPLDFDFQFTTPNEIRYNTLTFVDLCQAMTWHSLALFSATYNQIQFGYIRGDDFWHIRSEIQYLLYPINRLLSISHPRDSIIFQYPLEWYTKEQVVEIYKDGFEDLLELVYSQTEDGNKKDEITRTAIGKLRNGDTMKAVESETKTSKDQT